MDMLHCFPFYNAGGLMFSGEARDRRHRETMRMIYLQTSPSRAAHLLSAVQMCADYLKGRVGKTPGPTVSETTCVPICHEYFRKSRTVDRRHMHRHIFISSLEAYLYLLQLRTLSTYIECSFIFCSSHIQSCVHIPMLPLLKGIVYLQCPLFSEFPQYIVFW